MGVIAIAFGLIALFAGGSSAIACDFAGPPAPFGLPLSGAKEVSTATSVVIVAGEYPSWVEVTAEGRPVRIDGLKEIGFRSWNGSRFWRIRGLDFLEPNTEYVVTMARYGDGRRKEVTRFTTAMGYDKNFGRPPVLESLALWRIKYPVEAINAGWCVAAEYHGAFSVEYTEAIVPHTPPEATRYTLRLFTRHGEDQMGISFVGDFLIKGRMPEGRRPDPVQWPPAPDPTQEYCAMLVVEGYGDLARPPLQSNTICAKVTEIDTTAEWPWGGGNAAWDGGSTAGDGGTSSNGSAQESSGGCSTTGVGVGVGF